MRRVLVVGAGLAGLTAAHELTRTGAVVTIIDTRDRVGGRVWTVRDGFAAGQHAELGGEFIDEGHAAMRDLVIRFGLSLVRVLPRGFTHVLRPGGTGPRTVGRTRPWQVLTDAFAPLVRAFKHAGGETTADAVREISTYSVRGWLRHINAGPDVHATADSLRGFFLADPDDLSALPLVEQLAVNGVPAKITMYRVAGGIDRLLDAMVRDAPARLLLQHTLMSIDQAVDRVIAHVTDAQGHVQQIEADAAILTLPASTLRTVEIRPALPELQQRAISSLQYGKATKVAVQCDGAALRDRPAQAFATDSELGAFWDATAGQPSGSCSMLHFLAGGSASAGLQEHLAEGPGHLLSELCWLGLATMPIVASRSATWEHDRAAGGGYAFIDPAFDPAWRPCLGRRAGRLFFAGEHTSLEHQGYMEGAVETGQRAARELLATTR